MYRNMKEFQAGSHSIEKFERSILKELAQTGERLCYQLETGKGPVCGWVCYLVLSYQPGSQIRSIGPTHQRVPQHPNQSPPPTHIIQRTPQVQCDRKGSKNCPLNEAPDMWIYIGSLDSKRSWNEVLLAIACWPRNEASMVHNIGLWTFIQSKSTSVMELLRYCWIEVSNG